MEVLTWLMFNVLFMSLKAVWVSRLLKCDPILYSWAQLPNIYFKAFLQCNCKLIFNFDNVKGFPELQNLSPFYRDALLYYNTAYVTDMAQFKDCIQDQCIWANKYITVRKNNTKCVLFLRNWIRSGVNKIADLHLVDGRLDVNYIFTIIRNKSNILAEVKLVQNALLEYVDELKNMLPSSKLQDDMPIKSRFFYKRICESKFSSDSLPMYLSRYCVSNENIVEIFTTKLIKEPEIKIKEFNFKMLHGILPCNVNLKKWKIRDSNVCDVCSITQTIEHLLFDCLYVKPIWSLVEDLCKVSITYKLVLGLDNGFVYNNLVSLICFLIYKEWLMLSLQNKKRNKNVTFDLFKYELQLRLNVYEKCKTNIPHLLTSCMEQLIHGM